MFNSTPELLEKISLGEDSVIEFKEAVPRRDTLANEIGAFANAQGGVILVGVEDNGTIVGVAPDHLDRLEKIVIEVCRDSIEPHVNVYTEKLLITEKRVLKIEVAQSHYVHKSPEGCYRRQGSSIREMSPSELGRLMQSRSHAGIMSFDERAVAATDTDTLHPRLSGRFMREGSSDSERDTLLSKRKLLVKDERGAVRASVAGILMCHERPQDYIRNAFIQAVCYGGKIKDAHYQIDAKNFTQTLDRQIIDAYRFVQRYNKVSARKNIGREERPQYSARAVFEAVVNAVAHRDYSKYGAKIRLYMFADRLELYCPGALANTLTVAHLPYNVVTRTELVCRLLAELYIDDDIERDVNRGKIMEGRGEGVGIILRESEQLSGHRPLYEMIGEELKLTLFAAPSLHEHE